MVHLLLINLFSGRQRYSYVKPLFRCPEIQRYFFLTTFVQFFLPYTNADVPMIVEDSLVSFYPPVHAAHGTNCQGIRVARELLVTSSLCARAIMNKASKGNDIQILNAFENVLGKIIPAKSNQSLNPMDHDMLLDISEAEANEYDTYPALRNSDTPISAGFAYFRDENESAVNKRVSVTQLASSNEQQRFYDVSADESLPSGTVVMDDKSHLVCLISFRNQCASVPHGQVFLMRKLEQNEDSGENRGKIASFAPVIGVVGAALVVIAGVAGAFYGARFMRSRSSDIPAGGLLGEKYKYSYCKKCNALCETLCFLGCLYFVPTGRYRVSLWWAGPFVAAWNCLIRRKTVIRQEPQELRYPPSLGYDIDKLFED